MVHGPLNLISILDLWRDTRSQNTEAGLEALVPESIKYRATSPLYAEDESRIVLEESDGVGNVQILAPGDVVGMKAEIS